MSSGTAAALGLIHIRSFDAPTTAYIMIGERCTRDCAFCSQARSSASGDDKLSRVTWPEFDTTKFAEALGQAAAEGTMLRACIQVIGTPSAFDDATSAVQFLSDATHGTMPISVSFSATSTPEQVTALIEAGADRVALPIDACTPGLYRKIKGHDMFRALDLISRCAALHPGRISTHLIAGLGETEEDVLSVASSMAERGVRVGLFAFTPVAGTRLASASPPDLRSYRRVQLGTYLITRGYARLDCLTFQSGRMTGISLSRSAIEDIASSGRPFRTSGCPGCNRPYYNERPGGIMFNYPRPLTAAEAGEALADATADVALGTACPSTLVSGTRE